MYTGLLHTHNMFRWLVLIALILAVYFASSEWTKKGKWNKKDNVAGLLLVIFIDIQFLIGIILYAFVSPLTQAAFADFGAAMKNSNLRFYAVEHILMMFIALVLVHIGRAKSKRNPIAWKKHRTAAIFYGIALLVILAAIPWDKAFM
ncbi:MAG: cytochrome B [Bacteroidetes bacterium]|nr:cytochrome B [Bacteroidota bacterium]